MRDCHALSILKLSSAVTWCLRGASDKSTSEVRSEIPRSRDQISVQAFLAILAKRGTGLTTVTTKLKKKTNITRSGTSICDGRLTALFRRVGVNLISLYGFPRKALPWPCQEIWKFCPLPEPVRLQDSQNSARSRTEKRNKYFNHVVRSSLCILNNFYISNLQKKRAQLKLTNCQ